MVGTLNGRTTGCAPYDKGSGQIKSMMPHGITGLEMVNNLNDHPHCSLIFK
jgi:hypothetical protein